MPPRVSSHLPALLLGAALAVIWTWPLVLHVHDHVPGAGGDNYSFLWNLWWMRKALGTPGLEFFHSGYLFHPFGVDLINHPHTALQGYLSATVLRGLTAVEAENLYILVSVFLNAMVAYALAFDITRRIPASLLAAVAFGGSPYIAAHLLGHFDLLTAWPIPLFALFLRRALATGGVASAVGAGLSVAAAAYTAYYHLVYQALFAFAYVWAMWRPARVECRERVPTRLAVMLRRALVVLIVMDLALIALIVGTGGTSFDVGGALISVRGVQNPLLLWWLLTGAWLLTKWRVSILVNRPSGEAFWKTAQALTVVGAVFVVVALPLVVQAFRLVVSGRYVSQTYFWRSAPRGVDVLAPFLGNPAHPVTGLWTARAYDQLGLDRIDAVGWIGVIPIVVLLMKRGQWTDAEEARRWKVVLTVFAVWALGPFLTAGGVDLGLPLPQALARFVPLVDNARMPGRAMVGVFLSLGMLMALRAPRLAPGLQWALVGLLAFDYLHAPVPLTALDRPAVYEHLGSIADEGALIHVPFGIGDGLSTGRGAQDRRLLYHATVHGHPVVGGYIGRMPPGAARAYAEMPVVGNLLRLSSGEEALEEPAPPGLPFRYLVLDTAAASVDLIEYVRSTLDMDLIFRDGVIELYAVQGVKNANWRASAR